MLFAVFILYLFDLIISSVIFHFYLLVSSSIHMHVYLFVINRIAEGNNTFGSVRVCVSVRLSVGTL